MRRFTHVLAVLALWLGQGLHAADTVLRPRPIAEHVYLLPGQFEPGQQPDGNSVLFRGPAGWIVFDTGRHAAHTLRIQDFIRGYGERIDAIVNSHWHLDHVGGNARIRFKSPWVRVYASPAIEIAMETWLADYRKQLEQMIASDKISEQDKTGYRADIALINKGSKLFPDYPVTSTRNWRIAERRVRLGLETDAVTAGDVWLYDRRSRILAAGDLVTLPVPFFDTACPSRWSAALAGLEDMPFQRLVPGHGPLLNRDDYTRYRTAFNALLVCAASAQSVADCSDAWLQQTADWVPEAERERARSMLQYYFDTLLRAPEAQRLRYCPKADAVTQR
jgi:glyoxylase-like metal-dependent hydrolase (beta-lactamase superfamily II)